jgi:hypothetical protein
MPMPENDSQGRMTARPQMPRREFPAAGPQMPRREQGEERAPSRIMQQFPNAQMLPYIRGPVPDVIPPGLRPDNYSGYESFQRLPFTPGEDSMELFQQANNKARIQALINAMGGMPLNNMETSF